MDVLLVPVDGSYTLDLEGMMEVLQALKAPLMIPMHYFSTYTLSRFLDRARQNWTVETSEIPSLVIAKTSLPATPKVMGDFVVTGWLKLFGWVASGAMALAVAAMIVTGF